MNAGYLSGIISGPVDADKLDYVARDCHHSGLPLGIDLTRLISKLEVVVVTPDNATNQELRERAEQSPEKRFYDIGISQTGLGSYEQLIIARVLLYDRLYYHHKVRAAEAMLQSLIRVAEDECKSKYSIRDLFAGISDDVLVGVIGGELKSEALKGGGERSRVVGRAIQERSIHYRAYAFAARFIASTGNLPEKDQQDTRALLWRRLIRKLTTGSGCRAMARKIHARAVQLSGVIPTLADHGEGLEQDEILVDLPINRVVVRGGDILTREIDECLPGGLPASFHRAVADTISDVTSFADMIEKSGTWVSVERISEADLQSKLREHLRSRGIAFVEGAEVGGGETDLVLHDRIVVENKVAKGKIRDPFEFGPHYEWQARRYSMALCSRVAFVVFAYRPADEAARLCLPDRIRACAMPAAREDRCRIRVIVPLGGGVPSSAKRPADGRDRFER